MAIFGLDLKVKNNTGYTKLNPVTSVDQVMGIKAGSLYGPYVLTLTSGGWSNNQQTLALAEMKDTDIPMVVKVLSGTVAEITAQDEAYRLLDIVSGIQSLNGQIQFTATSTPITDFQVQVWWTR